MASAALPIFLDLAGLEVLFVGAGTAALSKWPALLASGARLTVVAPEVHPDLAPWLERVTLHRRRFAEADLDGVVLVYAFTDDDEVNHHIANSCRVRRLWHNTAAHRGPGAFTSPAVAHHNHLTLAVGSSGRSPAQAVAWRDRFSAVWQASSEENL